MKFKSYVLVVIAMLGALDGTALAQEAYPTYPMKTDAPKKPDAPKKVVVTEDQAGVVNKAPKKAPKKPSDKKVAQVPNDGKLKKPKLLQDPPSTHVDIDLDAQDSTLPPTEEPAPSAPAPTVEGPAPPPPAPSPAPVATVAPAAPPASPPPASEKAKEEGSLGFLDGAIMPSGQGGMIFGWSPKGKEPIQVGRTTSWAGLSGGVGEKSCDLNKRTGISKHSCVIFEGRANAYLDKDTVLMRDLFVGGRFHVGLFGMYLRLGAEEDIGETTWAFRPGSVVDPRVVLRDTFGHPGLSPIVGMWLGRYVMLRGEGNPQKKFYAARLDLHLPVEVNPWFDLNFNLDAGARSAEDEMGKVAKGMAGIDGLIKLKPRGYTDDGKPLDWGKLKFSLAGLFERQAELVPSDKVGKIQGNMHNVYVAQALLSWTGPENGPVRWQSFTAAYSYGRYSPIVQGYGGFSAFHVEQKTWFEAAQLAVIPFAAVAYGQNLKSVFKVPDLTADGGKPYWIFEIGVRGTFNDVYQWFDGKWGSL